MSTPRCGRYAVGNLFPISCDDILHFSQVCANAALISMAVGGVDPMKLDEHNEAQYMAKNGHNIVGGLGRDEVDFQPSRASPVEGVKFFIPERDLSQDSDSLAVNDPHVNHTGTTAVEHLTENWQNEARRGLQLLRFHSHMDLHANPVVKVNLLHQQPTLSGHEVFLFPEKDVVDTCSTNGELGRMSFTPGRVEEGRATAPTHSLLLRYTSVPEGAENKDMRRPFSYQRSLSDTVITEEEEKGVSSSLKKVGVYSSDLSLIPSSPRVKTAAEGELCPAGQCDKPEQDAHSLFPGSSGGIHLPSVVFHPSFLRRVSRQSSNTGKQQHEEVTVASKL